MIFIILFLYTNTCAFIFKQKMWTQWKTTHNSVVNPRYTPSMATPWIPWTTSVIGWAGVKVKCLITVDAPILWPLSRGREGTPLSPPRAVLPRLGAVILTRTWNHWETHFWRREVGWEVNRFLQVRLISCWKNKEKEKCLFKVFLWKSNIFWGYMYCSHIFECSNQGNWY